ncbi:MAG TPA: hypothetical protein VGL20_03075 [Candidatus Dormibacteraeota bacterium]
MREPSRPRPLHAGRRLLLAAAVLLALSGCGGAGSAPAPGTGAGSSSAPPGGVVAPARDFGDACRLLSPAEVQTALGRGPITAASEPDAQSGSRCTYTVASDQSGVPVLTLQVAVQASPAEARQAVDQIGGTALSGVGDAARSSTLGGLGVQVVLARGADLVSIATSVRDVSPRLLVGLATIVAGRL